MLFLATNDATKQILLEHHLMANLINGLRSTLDWQVEEDDFSRKLSTVRFMAECFQRHRERMISLEENEGYMASVEETSPCLSRRIDALRSEHSRLQAIGYRVIYRLEQASQTDAAEFASICADLANLLRRFEAHSKEEVALVHEAFDQESGGEG